MIAQFFSAVGTIAKPVFQPRGNTVQPTASPNGATTTGGSPAPYVPTLANGSTKVAPAVTSGTLASTGSLSMYAWIAIVLLVVAAGYWYWKK